MTVRVSEEVPDTRNAEKARRVMDVARALFMEHGYERVSVDEISAAAGISKATLYALFRSKDELLCEIFIDEMQEKMAGIARRCADIPDPLERLRTSITLALETTAGNTFLSQIISRPDGLRLPIWTNNYARRIEPIVIRRYAEPLQACIDRKAIRPLDVEATAYLIYRLIQAVSVASISGQNSAEQLKSEMLDFVMHAIGLPREPGVPGKT